MLQYLKIENLALLKSLSLDFDQGFSVVTGETGAGKSILLGALNLLSGTRSNQSLIREGAVRLSIEASFFFPDTQAKFVDALLIKLDLPACEEGTMILSRSLDQSKQSKIKINGALATLSQLKSLGEFWIDFHGPGESQKLFKESYQLSLLDAFSGNQDILKTYQLAYQKWKDFGRKLQHIHSSEQLDSDDMRFLSNELNKIQELDLSESALEKLDLDYTKISQSQECQSTLRCCLGLISGESGLMHQLNILNQKLDHLSTLDNSHYQRMERARSLQIEIDDLTRELESEVSSYDFDTETIDIVTNKMSTLQELKRKYGGSIERIKSEKKAMEEKLSTQGDVSGSIEKLENERAELEQSLIKNAKLLHKNRLVGSKVLVDQVSELLLKLGFKKAEFSIELKSLTENKFSEFGQETCQFLFSPNAGQGLLPLNKIASSGETARVMLALKTILADVDHTPILVFDEVDANVGGEVGRTVGAEISRISNSHQVFCVTHLPQVASLAKQHYLVDKKQDDSNTEISIIPIHGNEQMRLGEIARMLGDRSSKSALEHAKELLD